MSRYRFHTADVFTNRIFGGNPLAVFPDGRGLSGEQMQAVAGEFNLSETVFVFPPERPEHTRRLRIFTPVDELPFAGHPTVGTAHVLAATGEIPLAGPETRIVFEEGVGPVPVRIRSEDGTPTFAELTAAIPPEFGPAPPPRDRLAAALSLESDDILDGEYAPQPVSCGMPFLFVPVRDRAAVARAAPRLDVWTETLASFWAPQVFVFSRDPELAGSDVRARMFAPEVGVSEDPATGSAAAALGGYLGIREGASDGTLRWIVEQGFEMGRPSLLEVEADKRGGAVVRVRVGGASVLVSQGFMEIPDAQPAAFRQAAAC